MQVRTWKILGGGVFLLVIGFALGFTAGAFRFAKPVPSPAVVTGAEWRARNEFAREAEPEWRTTALDGFSVDVPYSPRWSVSTVGLSVYDQGENLSDSQSNSVTFGRPIDFAMSISRQYGLSQTPKEQLFQDPHGFDLWSRFSEGCPGHPFAERELVGTINGIKYLEGGAKGCNLDFIFNVGEHTYDLSQSVDFGETPPEVISDEMARIIKSVTEPEA